MRAVKIALAGRERYLCFTVEAMFQLQDKYGAPEEFLERVGAPGRDGFETACGAAAILAEQGELARRALGYDPEPILDAGTIAAALTPAEAAQLKLAIPAAMTLGFGREVEPDNGEVDLGLAELNAQKKTR